METTKLKEILLVVLRIDIRAVIDNYLPDNFIQLRFKYIRAWGYEPLNLKRQVTSEV